MWTALGLSSITAGLIITALYHPKSHDIASIGDVYGAFTVPVAILFGSTAAVCCLAVLVIRRCTREGGIQYRALLEGAAEHNGPYQHPHIVLSLLYPFLAGISGALAQLSGKVLIESIKLQIHHIPFFTTAIPYTAITAALITTITEIRLLNHALKHFEQIAVASTFIISMGSYAVLLGLFFWNPYSISSSQILLFIAGCIFSVAGVLSVGLGGLQVSKH